MIGLLKIIPGIIYMFIGAFSLVMAWKCLSAKKFLPFHEEASGEEWSKIGNNLQVVILALLKISGLGFTVISLLLMTFTILDFFHHDIYTAFVVPSISLVFCFGLFLINFNLYKKTKAGTPWKMALTVTFALTICLVLSAFC
jgi:hypothetical protein